MKTKIYRLPVSAAALIVSLLSFVVNESISEEKSGAKELAAALKLLQAEKAPTTQGNSAEAKKLVTMLSMVLGAADPKIPGVAGKPAPRPGQRFYCNLSDDGKRCVFLIHKEGLDRLPKEKRDFFIGMCVGMSEGAANRANNVKRLAVAIVWNEKVQWAIISDTTSISDSTSNGRDNPLETTDLAEAALHPFFAPVEVK